jgi:hypothetical protein
MSWLARLSLLLGLNAVPVVGVVGAGWTTTRPIPAGTLYPRNLIASFAATFITGRGIQVIKCKQKTETRGCKVPSDL